MAVPNYSQGDFTLSLYGYEDDANIPTAFIGLVGFVLVTSVHLTILRRHLAWHFWGMYLGLLMECIGMIARSYSACHSRNEHAYNTSYIASLLAPYFMAMGLYTTFSRIVWWITPTDSHRCNILWFPSRFISLFLVIMSLVGVILQFVGAYLLATTYRVVHTQNELLVALDVTRVGLVWQLIILCTFAIVVMRFLYISSRWTGSNLLFTQRQGANWRSLSWTIFMCTLAVVIHTVYRLAELLDSIDEPGYLMVFEWPFWVFDYVPMLGMAIALAIMSPAVHLPSEYLGLFLNKAGIQRKVNEMGRGQSELRYMADNASVFA